MAQNYEKIGKVALMHDYLNQCGGAERVLEVLAEIFPEAPIYTLFYDEKKTRSYFKNRVKKTSFLDFELVRNNHRAFIPLLPFASNSLKLEPHYDLVVSSSAGYAKGFNFKMLSIFVIVIPRFVMPGKRIISMA